MPELINNSYFSTHFPVLSLFLLNTVISITKIPGVVVSSGTNVLIDFAVLYLALMVAALL